MMINKGKHLYKIIPFWMKRERANPEVDSNLDEAPKENEKLWMAQDIKWSFSLSMPRWMWILLCLFVLLLIWI